VKNTFLAVGLTLLAATTLSAQTVGSLPDKSPYLDLNDGQRYGLVAGWLDMGHDAVGVGPKSAPMVGFRYDLAIGGPVYVTGTLFGVSTTRDIYDYTKSVAARDIGSQASDLIDASISIALAITGKRTWHRLQPLVNLGVGLVTSPDDKVDISGYRFGTNVSFSYGLGLRFATGKNSELRLDLNQYWWELKYPPLYRSTQGDPIAIKPNGALSSYTANTALTLGWTVRSFHF
jgi:hypothetical protein